MESFEKNFKDKNKELMVNEMEKEEFFKEWKKDWRERRGEFHTNQAELLREIRSRKNLEIRLERRMEEIMKKLSRSISEEVYPIKTYS